jgi:hypothetical protein
MLGRSKLATKTPAHLRQAAAGATMSARVRGSAVAVSANRGTAGMPLGQLAPAGR